MTRSPVSFEEVRRFLAEHYEARIGKLEPLHGGEWSSAFAFEHGGKDLVVRFGHYREDYEADREAFAFSSEELPVPPVFEIGEAFGGAYAISERRRGMPLETLSADGWRAILVSLWRALDRIRAIETPQSGTDWRESLLDLLEDKPGARLSGWSNTLAASRRISEVFRTGQLLLEKRLPQCPRDSYIVHNDLLHGNVLVDPAENRLTAVFDWGSSLRVDFLYEISHLVFFAPWFPATWALDMSAEALAHYRQIGLDVPDYEQRLNTYALHVGLVHIAYGLFARRPPEETDWVVSRTSHFLSSV